MSPRDTPLAATLRRLIAETGPLSVAAYMALCLGHPQHGYYMAHDPLGRDFTTAPEISQIFGESLAVWCALAWNGLGAPVPLALIELGPGRGTLMADLARSLERIAPALWSAATIHLVETSPVLQQKQARALAGRPVTWHDAPSRIPGMSFILLANEFFDSLPIQQFVRDGGAWRERGVDWDAERRRFVFRPGRRIAGRVPPALTDAADRTVYEASSSAATIAEDIGRRIGAYGGAALIIDYAKVGAAGDTLVAIQDQTKDADPLAAPGDADLSVRVDFAALRLALANSGARCYGPIAQRDLLLGLGIEARRAALAATAGREQAEELERGCARLLAPEGMGTTFQALAAVPASSPPPPAFAPSLSA